MSTPNYSKEVIKNRMYRHAMNYWGVKKVENLDPLVKVLLEALSSEIFGLSHDIETSQHRKHPIKYTIKKGCISFQVKQPSMVVSPSFFIPFFPFVWQHL